MFRKRGAGDPPADDLTNEAPADLSTKESHSIDFRGFGVEGKLSSSATGVGRAMGMLILVGLADGTGYLVAQLANRYDLHPGVAIPLVLATGGVVLLLGLWVIVVADGGGGPGKAGSGASRKAGKKRSRLKARRLRWGSVAAREPRGPGILEAP